MIDFLRLSREAGNAEFALSLPDASVLSIEKIVRRVPGSR
ncbi:MAG: hypothetical protein RL194_1091, partial [Pseudomonadota bacterium]